jgi:hypothetical protein
MEAIAKPLPLAEYREHVAVLQAMWRKSQSSLRKLAGIVIRGP